MKRLLLLVPVFLLSQCVTKSDLRREEELSKLRQDVSHAKSSKADFEVLSEEIKNEMSRLSNAVGETTELHRRDNEELKKELQTLSTRIQALEQRAVQEELAAKQPPPPPEPPKGFDALKKLLDEGKYDEAIEGLQVLAGNNTSEGRKAQFYMAEAHFAKKDFASAALEYADFRKRAPKDPLVPNAIFKQSLAFKSMGKTNEAKLFFQDLIDRYPKSPFATRAKTELKKIK